jgi:membrane protein implicated in regulation of membrane protease activity
MSVTGKGLTIWMGFLVLMIACCLGAYFLGQFTYGFAILMALWLVVWVYFSRKIYRNHRARDLTRESV